MKKTIILLTALLLMLAVCCGACAESYSVGICQLMVHDSLDQATQGFTDALTQEQVENMSPQAVKKNYNRILASMRNWRL